ALLLLRNLDEPSDDATGRAGLISASVGRVTRWRPSSAGAVGVIAVAAVIAPLVFGTVDLQRAQITLAYVVLFASIVCMTGYCGYITLGQAGFAGFGAFVS